MYYQLNRTHKFQVYQIKKCLRDIGFDKIEVGTVEAYQGKEKRIIIISTVRANCNLLDHDAKFQLGFLVDDKVRWIVSFITSSIRCKIDSTVSYQGKEKRIIIISTDHSSCTDDTVSWIVSFII